MRFAKVKIGNIGQVVTGKTPPTKSPELYGEVYPFITPTDIFDDSCYAKPTRYISEEGRSAHRNAMLPPDTVCYTCIASIGKACLTTETSLTNQQINSIIVDHNSYDYQFIYYLLKHETPRIKALASGVATPIINKSMFSEIELQVPPLSTQQKISAILSAYDDLIENNLRRINILEEMAQTLYREWFVKFRFPGHQKVKMVHSPLGKIPEGWEVSTVGDQITVVPRKNKIKTGDYLIEGVIPVIDQGKDFIAGYIDDTFLAYDGPLPIIVFGDHTCVLKWVDFRFAVGADGTQLIQSKHPEELPPRFLFYTLQFVPLEQFGYQRHFKYLKEAKILIPSGNLAQKFEEAVSFNIDLILKLQRQNLNLRRTRDLLLPKLISGKLDVSEFDIDTGGLNV